MFKVSHAYVDALDLLGGQCRAELNVARLEAVDGQRDDALRALVHLALVYT